MVLNSLSLISLSVLFLCFQIVQLQKRWNTTILSSMLVESENLAGGLLWRNTGIAASRSSENPQVEDSYAGSLHEGGEATSRSMPAAPYCQRLHKRQLYEGAVHTYAGSSYYRCKFSVWRSLVLRYMRRTGSDAE